MIELYGMSSPNVLKVMIMLEETELPYRLHFVNVAAGEQFAPEFVEKSPTSKVPVIIDPDVPGGRTVFESGAILYYLAEKAGRFLATDPAKRIEILQWLMVQVASVGPIFGQLNHFLRFAPAGEDYALGRYRTLAGRLYDQLEERLRREAWLAGGDYSIADIATYPWVALYHEAHGMTWQEHPSLKRWVDCVSERPAVLAARARYEENRQIDPSFAPGNPPDGLDRFFGRGAYQRAG